MKTPRRELDPNDLSDNMAILDPLKSFNLQKIPKSVNQTNSSSLLMLCNLDREKFCVQQFPNQLRTNGEGKSMK
jgi:exopolysaccharide biosynthesis predicted pyruvyltransferase EpsI